MGNHAGVQVGVVLCPACCRPASLLALEAGEPTRVGTAARLHRHLAGLTPCEEHQNVLTP